MRERGLLNKPTIIYKKAHTLPRLYEHVFTRVMFQRGGAQGFRWVVGAKE